MIFSSFFLVNEEGSRLCNPVFLYIWYSSVFENDHLQRWFCVLFLWEWFVHRNDELWLHVESWLPGLGGLWTSGCRVTRAAPAWQRSASCLIWFYMHLTFTIFVNKLTYGITPRCVLSAQKETIWMETKVYLQDVHTHTHTHQECTGTVVWLTEVTTQLTSTWDSDGFFPLSWSTESCAFALGWWFSQLWGVALFTKLTCMSLNKVEEGGIHCETKHNPIPSTLMQLYGQMKNRRIV